MLEIFGDRQVAVGREISKLHEEFIRGRVSEVLSQIADGAPKGEITLIVHGCSGGVDISAEALKAEVQKLLDHGLSVRSVSELLSERHAISRREIYQLALEFKKTGKA
jgi:16S rRNA (cytidine1402-2'-O)-methyltransferase